MSTRPHWGRTRVTADDIQRLLGGPTRVRGFTLPCMHFPRTLRFYTDRLGLRLVGQTRGHAVLDAAGIRIVLIDASKVIGFARKDGQGLYLELEVGDLAAVVARLKEDGGAVAPTRRSATGQLLTVQDPEGNLVNLVEPAQQRQR